MSNDDKLKSIHTSLRVIIALLGAIIGILCCK
nr:MAG TPA: hypothetical protein [Caudoviricetes sp.]